MSALVSQPLPNFVQGVSQQSYALRQPTQGEEQINGVSSPVEGLGKRPPTEYIGTLGTTAQFGTAKLHSFNRDSDEQGTLILPGDGSVAVRDFTGATKTVSVIGSAGTYVNSVGDPANDLVCVTLADYTFVVNKNIKPAMTSDTYYDKISDTGHKTCVWVRTGQLETPYTIRLYSDTSKTTLLLTATYNPAATASNAETVNIATQLQTAIHGVSGFTCTRYGSVLFIHRGASTYGIEVEDGRGNDAMVLIDRTITDVTSLPPVAIDRYQVEVVGDLSTEYDNHWVEFDPDKSVWNEVAEPGRTYKLDPATMPHILVRTSGGTYEFKEATWADCLAGDSTTNPEPSFIGEDILDVFYHRGRLGFITAKTVVMSQPNDLFNFWRDTVTVLRDSAPIDVEVTMEKPKPMYAAVEAGTTVMFFNNRGQFALNTPDILSPSTVGISKVSEFESDSTCPPVISGDRVYFSQTRGAYSAIMSMKMVPSQTGGFTFESDDVTRDTPRYVLGKIKKLLPMPGDDMIFALTDQDDNILYAYQYQFSNGQKVQNAIHKWQFDTNNALREIEADGYDLYTLSNRAGDGLYMFRTNLQSQAQDGSLGYKILLDERLDETQVTSITYNATDDQSVIELPVTDDGGALYSIYGREGSILAKPGENVSVVARDAGLRRITVSGDWRTDKFYCGKQYEFEYTLSTIVYRDRRDNTPLTSARLQLHKIDINYARTGYLKATITPTARTTRTKVFTGRKVGTNDALIGSAGITNGTLSFPVRTQNLSVEIKLSNDSPFPSWIQSGAWSGRYGLAIRRA